MRPRLLSDRQAEIIRAINPRVGARAIAPELQIDPRVIRHARNRAGAYAESRPEIKDNEAVERRLRRRFPAAVQRVDSRVH